MSKYNVMDNLGNVLIGLSVIIIIVSIIGLSNRLDSKQEACIQKSGIMVKGTDGWICIKAERL